MILPILGAVMGFGKQRLFSSGESDNNGFGLKILKKPDYSLHDFAIAGFDKDQRSLLLAPRTTFFLRAISFLIALCFIQLTYSANAPFIFNLFYYGLAAIVIGSAVIWLYVLVSVIKRKELREWHACEHKSIVLLEAGLEPTVENLRKCPAVLINCGTVHESAKLELYFCVFYALSRSDIFSNPNLADWLVVAMWISCMFYLFFATASFSYFHFLFFPFWLPCIFLPLLAEKFCSTKNPSPDKLERTIWELKVFIQRNRLYD